MTRLLLDLELLDVFLDDAESAVRPDGSAGTLFAGVDGQHAATLAGVPSTIPDHPYAHRAMVSDA